MASYPGRLTWKWKWTEQNWTIQPFAHHFFFVGEIKKHFIAPIKLIASLQMQQVYNGEKARPIQGRRETTFISIATAKSQILWTLRNSNSSQNSPFTYSFSLHFLFKDLKSRDLKNNCQYKLLDINLSTYDDANFGDFAQ